MIVTILRFCLGAAAVQNKASSVSWPIDENSLSAICDGKRAFTILLSAQPINMSIFHAFLESLRTVNLRLTCYK
jgi:hypothetical protein